MKLVPYASSLSSDYIERIVELEKEEQAQSIKILAHIGTLHSWMLSLD